MTIKTRNTSSLAALTLVLAMVLTACPGPTEPVNPLQFCPATTDKINVPIAGISVEGEDYETAIGSVERRSLSKGPCALRGTSNESSGEYALNLAQASDFDMVFNVNAEKGAKLRFELDGNPMDNTLDVTPTGDTFKEFTVPLVTLPGGEHKLRVVISDLNGSSAVMIDSFKLAKPSKNLPYNALPSVPFVLEAEHFDRGGPIVAYLDNTPGNSGTGSRISNVDIDVQGNDQFLTNTQTGEYLKYSFNVPAALKQKYFKVSVRYASSVAGGKFSLGLGGRKLFDKVTVQASGGDTSWRNEEVVVPITPGSYQLVLIFDSQSNAASVMNVDRIEITVDSDVINNPPPPTPDGVVGEVSQIYQWPLMPIHAALMPNGKVYSWGGGDNNNGGGNSIVLDPSQGAAGTLSNNIRTQTTLFCAGFSHLPNGQLLIAGGHWDNFQGVPDTNIFDYKTQVTSTTSSMFAEKLPNAVGNPKGDASFNPNLYYRDPKHTGRWYPTTTALANGEILVSEGYSSIQDVVNNLPEVWQSNNGGGWRALSNAQVTTPGALSYYPFQYPRPNGEVVRVGPESGVYAFSTGGTGAVRKLNNRPDGMNRDYGSAAMFAPGKILLVGGNGGDGTNRFPSNSGVIIDIRNDQPTYTSIPNMQFGRRHLSTTVLPTGDVLISGGSSGQSGHNKAPYPFEMEVYNVKTNTFKTVANLQRGRGYHSIALLLPDGRILIGGGGNCAGCQTNVSADAPNGDQNNIEYYKPPYLFKPDGSGGQTEVTSRPVITNISRNGSAVTIDTDLGYNQDFQISTSGKTIARVTMVKLGAVTHARNFDQNFNQLNFTDDGSSLTVTTPNEPAWATPGHYMLFAIDTDGVPSVAKIIKLR
jgi:Domain of unknown function (DUF1929)/Carbohydrate binding module (family 6)